MNILGIETSCDETAAAVVQNGRRVLSSVVASQMGIHRPFRGVVPELASRSHVEKINSIIDEALKRAGVPIHGVAVTKGPGLIGSLLVGVVTAQAWAWAKNLPVWGVNHLEGHLFAALVEHPSLRPPFLGLIVSGGHTELHVFKGYGRYETLGKTRDDAAGEAFDKVAALLGLSYPGGPAIQKAGEKGNPAAIRFPRAWIAGTYDFSFSGLKTSVIHFLQSSGFAAKKKSAPALKDICASFEESVVDVLVRKTLDAARAHSIRHIVVGGGVAANRRLRNRFLEKTNEAGMKVFLPDLSFCTDNAAMIAAAAYFQQKHPKLARVQLLEADASSAVVSW